MKKLVDALTTGNGFVYAGQARITLLDDGNLYVDMPANVGAHGEGREFLRLEFFVDVKTLVPEKTEEVPSAQAEEKKEEPAQM